MSRGVRCAIYTRKSTEEGLDQSFNSLDAQREACEAYVRSQVGEGWRAIPAHYDDGGYSGGNLDRPAMQQLLADVDAGKVDVIVVYKVDRLTRSLLDFAKVVERLDARDVSFVSVTQAFNTTSSMGRLTLNVLLSFAQFEREVTGERIRDKIAASKAKGIWMGGNVPLGYDLRDRRLCINPGEAAQVQHIFERYLVLKSGVELMKELRRKGLMSKRWVSRAGRERGGAPFSCGALYYLLQNRLYLGEIVHRGVRHEGQHDAIISIELFNSAQCALAVNRQKRRDKPARATTCALAGLVRDSEGRPMTTSFSYGRGGRLYRYYVAGSLDPSRSDASLLPKRYPAAPLEQAVLHAIGQLRERPPTLSDTLPQVSAVELYDRSIQVVLKPATFVEPHEPIERAETRLQAAAAPNRLIADGNHLRIVIDREPLFRRRSVSECCNGPPVRSDDAAALLQSAHRLAQHHSMSPLDIEKHPTATAPAWQRDRRLLALALLAPDVQKAILRGQLSSGSNQFLSPSTPLAWADQRSLGEPSRRM